MTIRQEGTAWSILPMAIISATAFGQATTPGSAADYPSKTIRMVVGGAGTGSDLVARVVTQGLAGPLGQQVVVINYPSGFVPGETAARAAPDGYTLLSIASTLWLGPLMQKTPYDAIRDFSPISLVAVSPQFLVVHPSLPVKAVKDLIALAKARPGELNYAVGATGSGGHLAALLFQSMAGVNMVRVSYTSGSGRMGALIGGEIQLEFLATGIATPHLKSGRLRALGITSAERSALAPELPTIAASGLPGYESTSTYGIFAPAKAPAAIVQRLSQEIGRVVNGVEVKAKFLAIGIESVGSGPEKFAAIIKADIFRMDKVFREAGIRVE